ncbi:hypothetical protein KP509_35G002200 [Ceratopteris richardii]|uniref:Leucine-rich repeat-containing N-terminal plant-type domain-containing protein n=1 Tax=Ceratopteris richardii TaxID=49495 RepID=A0A8T2QE90_CERRI|nr:hypothetical protein KP509_35G002200 [Ceratopteris richardii]
MVNLYKIHLLSALMAFKRGISRDIHNILGSWDASLATPLGWFHVTCDAAGRVIRLDLSNEGLVGTIAPQLAELDELQFLEVNGNFLVGHIPPVLGNVLNLVSLDLSHNFLSGPIPLGFENFIRGKLKFLRLEVNSLTGPISWNLGFVPLYML